MTSTSLPQSGSLDRSAVEASFRGSLARLRGRVRGAVFVEGLSLLLRAFLGYFALTLLVDRWLRLEQPVRVVLLAGFLAWLVVRFYQRVFTPFRQSLDDEELALAVERARPGLGQRLISGIQFQEALRQGRTHGASAGLMRQALAELAQVLPTLDFDAALRRERVRRNNRNSALAGLLLVLIAGFYPGFGTWAWRNLLLSASVDWPRYVDIHVNGVKDGVLVLPRGDDITVEATVRVRDEVPEAERAAYMPTQVLLSYEFDNGASGTEPMVQNTGEDVFSYTFPSLLTEVEFEVHGGDGLSELVRVQLVDRPRLLERELTLHYPAYLGLEPLPVPADAVDLIAPIGSEIEVRAKSDVDLVSSGLSIGEGEAVPIEVAEDRRSVHGRIAPRATGVLRIRLKDVHGLGEGEADRLLIKVVPDRAPRLGNRLKGIGAKVTPQAILPMDLEVRDDFGIRGLELWWGAGDSAAIGSGTGIPEGFRTARPIGMDEFEEGATEFQRRVRFDLLPLLENPEDLSAADNPIRPGQFLALRWKAWDALVPEGASEPQSAYGEAFTLKVVEPAELLAELIRRQREQRLEFERIVQDHQRDMGDFRTLDDPNTPDEKGRRIKARIADLARHQRHLARSVQNVGNRYAEILDEMRNNRLEKADTLNKLENHIVEPLEDLAKNWMPDLARRLTDYQRAGQEPLKAAASDLYDEIYRRMMRILSQMKKLESFTEILSRLKEIIRLEDDVKKMTEDRLKKSLEDLFGPQDGGKKDEPEPQPKGGTGDEDDKKDKQNG
ncbi:MAG: hypothetical protein R3F30_10065 [Planctomycetota bacterium]